MSIYVPALGPLLVQAPAGVSALQDTLIGELIGAGLNEPTLEGLSVDETGPNGTAPSGYAYAQVTLSSSATGSEQAIAASTLDAHI